MAYNPNMVWSNRRHFGDLRALVLVFFNCVGIAACPVALPELQQLEFACQRDDECARELGYYCHPSRNVCVHKADSGPNDTWPMDQQPPDVRGPDVGLDAGPDDRADSGSLPDLRVDGTVTVDGPGQDHFREDGFVPDIPNAPPVVADSTVVCYENMAPCSFTVNASDPDSVPGPLVVQVVRSPNNGQLSFNGMAAVYTPRQDHYGDVWFSFLVSDGADDSGTARVTIRIISRRSCAMRLLTGDHLGDGIRDLDVDGSGPRPEFTAYCDMTNAGGGWTLALKVDGRQTTFLYDAGVWTDGNTLNETAADLDSQEAKLASFLSMRFTQILVGMRPVPGGDPFRYLALDVSGTNLHEVISAGTPVRTYAGQQAWLGLLPGAGLEQHECGEGFNAKPSTDSYYPRARIGAIANNEIADCDSPDSAIGIGLAGDSCSFIGENSAGSRGCYLPPDEHSADIPAFGIVFVRDADFSSLQERSSCYDHRLAGATIDGLYPLRPASQGAVFNAYCDMTSDGGGWTIINSITGSDGEQPLVSDVLASGNPLIYQHYNLDVATKVALSALSTATLFKRRDGPHLIASAPLFDDDLAIPGSSADQAVSIVSNDGTMAQGRLGWSNYGISAGGDVGVIIGDVEFDLHATSSFFMLNAGCAPHLLYSYSSTESDSDAGYGVNTTLGDWTGDSSCHSGEGGSLAFRTALR